MKTKRSKKVKGRHKSVYKTLTRIYRLFRTNPQIFSFRKLRGYQGICYFEEENIYIDPRKEFISTLVHECIHFLYPKYSETRVMQEEKMIMNTITPRQVKNLLIRFANIL